MTKTRNKKQIKTEEFVLLYQKRLEAIIKKLESEVRLKESSIKEDFDSVRDFYDITYSPKRSKAVFRMSIKRGFERIRAQSWPDDMQPSKDTITRAEDLWTRIQNNVSRLSLDTPNISAADDNSVDIFWGDRKERVLLNVPASREEKLFIHFINKDGQTIIHFTDRHTFNVSNVLRELKSAID
ncbi:hypothetical protein [Deinococcus sp.]|uniref:hypothetical protein n=1 Tax=Deinococcus sp. TaxID=47478 RepID=UPI003CC68A46